VLFVLYKFSDILTKILPLFNANPLLGVKGLDLKDFQKVAFMMKDKFHLTKVGIFEIYRIKSGMNRGRKQYNINIKNGDKYLYYIYNFKKL
jgi:hypothetical protein